jgi:hypothetical protein
MSHLATTMGRNARQLHSDSPLSDDQIMRIAPSAFALAAHESRSTRYAYIPTSEILTGLRKEGFQPFFAAQATTRKEGHATHTKHMLRLRHADHLAKRDDVNEVILINSHNGTSSYQMLAGVFRFVCMNGMVCGNIVEDIRVQHKGNVQQDVLNGAFQLLSDFQAVDESKDAFKAIQLTTGEQEAYASAAIAFRFNVEDVSAAPVTVAQVLQPRRFEDRGASLWNTFQRVQENTVDGGLRARSASNPSRRAHTRAVGSIDGNVNLNRALWVLAEQLRKNHA